jgi:hypothetical protein
MLSLTAVTASCAAFALGSGGAATSPWIAKANATCTLWHKKAVTRLGAHPKQPTTLTGVYRFVLKAQPIEAGELHALQAIPGQRPPGAAKALSYASLDVKEIDAAIADWRAGDKQAFAHDVDVWQSDHRASRAFVKLGATACG